MTLDGKLHVETAEEGPERPRRSVVKVTLPSSLAFAAKKVEAALPAGTVRITAGATSAVGPVTLRVRCELFHRLNEVLAGERACVRVEHPVERHCLSYRVPHSEEEARQMLDASLPESVTSALFPFQREGVLFALRHDARVLIADEMGLGKTVQAIATALCFVEEWPMLVMCPASLCANWHAELLTWMGRAGISEPQSRVHVIRSGKDSLQAEGERGVDGVSIVSYDLASKLAERLERVRFGVCVCDESHNLKNPTAARTVKLLPLATKARRSLFLSGTPVLSRPIEIYTQAHALRPHVFGAQREFSIRYCAGHQGRFGWDEKGASNCEALCAVLTHVLMIRREKAAVLTQLPDKMRCKLSVDISQKERSSIKAKLERVKQESDRIDGPQNNPIIGELYQQTGLAKVPGVTAHVETLVLSETTTKLLLFAHHHSVLDSLANNLTKAKVTHVRIDGRTSLDARSHAVKRFQSEANVRVALLSIAAAGVGLTLTAATVVVFAECSWDIGGLRQAEDRAHRIGQKNAVLVQYCLADGTLDDWMWRTVERKLEVTTSAIGGASASAAHHAAGSFAAEWRAPRAPDWGSHRRRVVE